MSLPISTSKCHCVPNAQLLNFSFLLSLSLTPKVIYLIFGGKRNCQSWGLKSFPHTDLVFINYEVWIGMATGRSPVRKNSPYHLCLEGDIEKSREDDTWWRLILFYSRHREDSVVSPWLTSWIPSLWGQGETVRESMVIRTWKHGDTQQWLQTPAPLPSGQVITPWYWFFCWESKQ